MIFPFNLLEKVRLSVDEELQLKPQPFSVALAPNPKPRLLTTAEILKVYGNAGDPDNLETITIPFPFRIAWVPGQTTNRVMCHKKIKAPLLAVLNELIQIYGPAKIKELGIDLFGGLNNFRPQRNTEEKYKRAMAAKNYSLALTYLSRHAWAIAIDLDPARNQLKQSRKTAQFAKPEYKPMIDCFYKHGFISYGRERNNDFMHFEIGITVSYYELIK